MQNRFRSRVAQLSLIAFAVLNIGATSNGPGPSGGKSEQHKQAPAAQEHRDGQNLQRGTPEAPLVVEVRESPLHDEIAAKLEGKSKWYTSPDWWVAVFTGLLVIVTGGLWFATKRMWQTTQQAVRDGADGIEAAREANQIARRDYDALHRPKFHLRRIDSITLTPDQPVHGLLSIANVGESDGHGFELGVDFFVVRPSGLRPFINDDKRPYVLDIPQGKQANMNLVGGSILTARDISEINSGVAILAIILLINYRGALGIQRTVSVYRHYVPNKRRFIKAPDDDEFAEWEYED